MKWALIILLQSNALLRNFWVLLILWSLFDKHHPPKHRSGQLRTQGDKLASSFSRSSCCYEGVYSVCSCVQATAVCQRDIHRSARTHGFTAERGIETQWWMLFLSPITCSNFVALSVYTWSISTNKHNFSQKHTKLPQKYSESPKKH